jgi:hypothetical protein
MCAFIQSSISAAVVELVHIGLRDEIPFRQGFQQALKKNLTSVVLICYVLAASGVYVSVKLVRDDMEKVDVLKRRLSSRTVGLVVGLIAIVALIIVIIPFSVE